MLGSPGTGKGTYSSRLSPILRIPHISTGDIFRENIAKKTELGKKVEKFLDSGELVPDYITVEVVKERLKKPDCKNGFILDGFPRTIKQAQELDKITKIDFVVNLNVPKWLILERFSTRRTCKNCGEIYDIRSIKPKKEGICDRCGGQLIKREDETPKSIEKRLKVYNENTKPLIDYYKNKGILLNASCNKLDSPPELNVKKILNLLGVIK